MDMPADSADALLRVAVRARSRARSDRAWVWLPTAVFAGLTLLSVVMYLDWGRWGNYAGGVEYRFDAWSWGWGGSAWPTLYWLAAAPFGTWLSHRLALRREAQLGVRLGAALPVLVAVLAMWVLVRTFTTGWADVGFEVVATPVALLGIAVWQKERRAVAALAVPTLVALFFVLFNWHTRTLLQGSWLLPAEVAVVALALAAAAVVARPGRKRADASGS